MLINTLLTNKTVIKSKNSKVNGKQRVDTNINVLKSLHFGIN